MFLLELAVLANHVLSHISVGIFDVVYSSVDHINTTCLSPSSCHSTGYEPGYALTTYPCLCNLCQWTFICSRGLLNTSLKTIGIPFSDLSSDPIPAPVGWELLHRPSVPPLVNNLSSSRPSGPPPVKNPSPSQSLCLPLDQGVPLSYPSPPLSPSPPQMVARTKKSYKRKTAQRCCPRDKSQQVRMSLKLSVMKLQDKYGLSLVQESWSKFWRR